MGQKVRRNPTQPTCEFVWVPGSASGVASTPPRPHSRVAAAGLQLPGSESAEPGAAGGEGASRGWPELPRGASWLSALQEVRLFERANHT